MGLEQKIEAVGEVVGTGLMVGGAGLAAAEIIGSFCVGAYDGYVGGFSPETDKEIMNYIFYSGFAAAGGVGAGAIIKLAIDDDDPAPIMICTPAAAIVMPVIGMISYCVGQVGGMAVRYIS